jgi:hypothetical protein
MKNHMRLSRATLVGAIAVAASLIPFGTFASSTPSGERQHGQVAVEPAYDDYDGSIVYLATPGHLAPLGPTNETQHVNPNAVAPIYLVVYPAGTPGVFDCMGVPGNCPDHDGAIAGLATSMRPDVYGTNPNLVPGHDHLVGMPHTGDFNVAWRVYVELFTPTATITHITTLGALNKAKSEKALQEIDTGIVFHCSVVNESAYMAGTPL